MCKKILCIAQRIVFHYHVIQVIINFLQSIKNIVNLLKTIVKVINGVILAIYAVTAVLPTMFLTAGVVLGFEKILKTIQKTIYIIQI